MRSREGGASYGLAALGGAVVVFVGLAFGLHAAGFRINLSVSLPLGVYRVVDQGVRLHKGTKSATGFSYD